MLQGTEAVAPVYNALQALRGRCHELMHQTKDNTVLRLLKDLGDQHAWLSSEVAVLLSDFWAADGIRAPSGAGPVSGPVAQPGLPRSAPGRDTDIFGRLRRAEKSLLAAYDEAIGRQHGGSALLALLARHRLAILTSLQRIEALER